MDFLMVLAALVAIAVGMTLVFGWRDGWLRLPRAGFTSGNHQCNHAAIARIVKFDAVRRRIGYQDANSIVRVLAERIAADKRCRIGRIGRTSIEFLYYAADAHGALAAMQSMRLILEQSVTIDSLRYDPEVVIGSNRLTGREADGETFDLSAWAVENAFKQPDRISFAELDQHAGAVAQSSRMLPDLAAAIRGDGLELHYMPKLRLADDTVTGAEALCRWTHPRHGSVPPGVFIALAEETGLIRELTLWTLDRAAADQARLLEHGIALDIDVNLSGQLVSDIAFCQTVLDRITRAPGKIGLEITETAAIEDPQVGLDNLTRIAEAGVHIAIDDFGAGLSSLSYLRDLPAQELKVDQSFIRSLTTSNRDPLLVRSAIEIARALEMEVTAEGVEDELALSLLRVMRCDNVQGFHISQPLPLAGLIEYLRTNAQLPSEETDRLRGRFTGGGQAA